MRRGKGFILLEVMAGIVVWAMAVLACGHLLAQAVQTQRKAERRWSEVLACRCALETAWWRSGASLETIRNDVPPGTVVVADSTQVGMLRLRAFCVGAETPGDTAVSFSRLVWRGRG